MAWNWDRDYQGDGYAAASAADTGTGMDDFLASARKLTDQFLEQSRRQAEKIVKDANAQADQILGDARQKADEILRDAENHAEQISLQAQKDADALLEQAHADAEEMRSAKGTVDQEYAVQCVSDCFEEIRRRQEEMLDVLNAQWQKFLIGLMPSDEELPGPEPEAAPAAEPDTAQAEVPEEDPPEPEPELPHDLEEKVSALSREMDELFWKRKS